MHGYAIKFDLGSGEGMITIERFIGPSPESIIEEISWDCIAPSIAKKYNIPINDQTTYSVSKDGVEFLSARKINFAAV
jgi:hypothetical protein